jgi:hypothetical protein
VLKVGRRVENSVGTFNASSILLSFVRKAKVFPNAFLATVAKTSPYG